MKKYFENLLHRSASARRMCGMIALGLQIFPFLVIFLMTLRFPPGHHIMTPTHGAIFIILISIVGASGFSLRTFLWKTSIRLKLKPRVVVWTIQNLTMLAAKEDYELGLKQRERWAQALDCSPSRFRVHPRLYTIFTDWNQFTTHATMSTFERLTEGCVVEKSEMHIPYRISNEECVSGDRMWRLVHGTEAPADLV